MGHKAENLLAFTRVRFPQINADQDADAQICPDIKLISAHLRAHLR